MIRQIAVNPSLATKYAVLLVDPHGDLSFSLLRILPDLDHVSFLDPWLAPYAHNPLKLPTTSPWPRERLAEWFAGTNTEAFCHQLGLSPARAPRATAIYRTEVEALYMTRDDPTIVDLYRLNQSILLGTAANQIASRFNLGNDALATLRPITEASVRLGDSLIAIDYRLHPLVQSPTLRRTFCPRASTLDFARMLNPGQVTIFRLASTDLPAYLQAIQMASVLLNVWFAALQRASTVMEEARRTPVLLFLDEFPMFAALEILDTVLAQGRKFGLFPVISHQNVAQLTDRQLQTILANIPVRVAFACSMDDARKLASNMDPYNPEELAHEIASLGKFEAIVDDRWATEAFTPVRIRCLPPPPQVKGHREVAEYLSRVRDERVRALAAIESAEKPRWVERYYPAQRPPTPSLWPLIVALLEFDRDRRPATLSALSTSGLAYIPHNKPRLAKLLDQATAHGYVQPIRVGERVIFVLSESTKRNLFPHISATSAAKAGLEQHRAIRLQLMWKYARLGQFPIGINESLPGEDPDLILLPPAEDRDEWDLLRARGVEVEIWPEKHPERVRWHVTNDLDNHQLNRVLFVTSTEKKRLAILDALQSCDARHTARVDVDVLPHETTDPHETIEPTSVSP